VSIKKPKTEEDWEMLSFEINQLFDGAPVDEAELFAGRLTEIRRILEAVMSKSTHVVLYGERGVGKTSLSNIFWKRFGTTLQSFLVSRVQANPTDTFHTLWSRALDELKAASRTRERPEYTPFEIDFDVELTPTEVRRALAQCSPNSIPIVIIDEFNEIDDEDAKLLTANLIKEMYDYGLSATVLLVGVAENIGELLSEHRSIGRALVQIPLRRMSEAELKEIIDKRTARTLMKFDGDSKWTIITLSRGLPFFTQTLSKYAAQNAVKNRRLNVGTEDVEAAMDKFIEYSEITFKDAYRVATRSNQSNFFKQSLLACALADTDDEGWFSANDVLSPYSAIMKSKKTISHYEKHLARFSSDEGGRILSKRGGERQQQFRFADPMMQPYVIISGIQSKMINEQARTNLLQREEPTLPI